jgi:hypothetical protein
MDKVIIRRRWLFGTLIALIALVTSINALRTTWAQDDIPLLLDDERVSNPERWDEYLNEAYWPAPLQRDLYRPVSSLLFGVEWQMGNGYPQAFRVTQLTLYIACCIIVFALLLRLLTPWAALVTALFFTVHPVHVEAVAVAVNQSEVLVGALSAAAVAWYLGRRRSGPLGPAGHLFLAGITLVASHVKESGIMVPAILFAALVILGRTPWQQRKDEAISLIVWQSLAVVIVMALRSRIEFETASGTFVTEAFDNQPVWGRFMTMLRIVPEWMRLLLWPATLSSDYSPGLIIPATSWGLDQTLGLTILLLVIVLAWRLRTTTPVASFGIAWCAAGLFPVHNVLVPTGIALAERTLFLPSIGALIAVGAVLERVPKLFATRPVLGRRLLAAGCAIIVVLGMSRSISRHRVWRNNYQLWGQTVIDNPDGYRPRMALGSLLQNLGHRERAVVLYQQAIALWDRHWGADFQLATWYRTSGDCTSAVRHYRRVLELKEVEAARAAMVACLVFLGEYAQAKEAATLGFAGNRYGQIQLVWYRTADAALKRGAPPGSVRFPVEYAHLLTNEDDLRNVLK